MKSAENFKPPHPLMPAVDIGIFHKGAMLGQPANLECGPAQLAGEQRPSLVVGNNAKSGTESRRHQQDIVEPE
jgi:hypothetical protein